MNDINLLYLFYFAALGIVSVELSRLGYFGGDTAGLSGTLSESAAD